jgi:signal transduction histidine kinase
MRLVEFIRTEAHLIIAEWESFAETLTPAATSMTPKALRNHITEILAFIAADIESQQTDLEQFDKSHGRKIRSTGYSAAETHAALREAGGFNMNQMVSEYRALRASVTKLWKKTITSPTDQDIVDLIRFNEAIDQELTESISFYSQKLEGAKTLFLGILSHDLRNPIGVTRMSATLALHIGDINERQKMLLSQIVNSADRAIGIVNSLLDLTRARLGAGLPVIIADMNIGFVSRQLIDEMRMMHSNRTFILQVSGDTQGEWDKARIGQVLSNLLGNAVQYGFRDMPVSVAVEGRPDEVTICVHNDGVPIPENKIDGVFDALTRGLGEDRGKTEMPSLNLGLGLFITKEIVTAHGGILEVTSSEKAGTRFTAHFPRKRTSAATPSPNKPSCCPQAPALAGNAWISNLRSK